MDDQEVGNYWNKNAEVWSILSRSGYDIYRDYLNTPAFFEMLPEVRGLQGLDIGCGEGHNTRLVTQRGASMTAIDISEIFIEKAQETEVQYPLGIHFQVASAQALPFPEHHFDFATSFMCLMDVPELDKALAEAYRVIRPGGFLQFSISHPCFDTPIRRNKKDAQGSTYAIEVGGYFATEQGQVEEWIFGAAPTHMKNSLPKFKIPKFNHTLSYWVNAVIRAGFVLEKMQEPCPSDDLVKQQPRLKDSQQVAYFLHMLVRKP